MALFQPDASNFHNLKSTPKTILITGGSSGIGLATAQLLSSLNPKHNLILLDLQAPPSSFHHDPAHLLFQACNITSWEAQRAAFEVACARFGRIDAVFVNAGIIEHGDQLLADTLDSTGKLAAPDHRTLTVDLNAASDTIKLAIHHMRTNGPKEGGSIVITSSLAGYFASANLPLYSAAKHGALGLMRALKLDCARLGIGISVIAPGVTITPMLGETAISATEQEVEKLTKAGMSLNKVESVALVVCWLLNEGAKANGAGILIQGDQFVDVEKGLAKSRKSWMGEEMANMFRGGKKALL